MSATDALEQREIETLEEREARAMLGADVSTLQTLWADDLIVNSTSNLIAGKQILLEMIKSGRLKLRSYERRPVRIVTFGDLVVATGNEVSQLVGRHRNDQDLRQLHERLDEAQRKLAIARASCRIDPAGKARTSAIRLSYERCVGEALSLAERRASTRRLMTAASSAGSTGFTTWLSKPAEKTSTRSSTRP